MGSKKIDAILADILLAAVRNDLGKLRYHQRQLRASIRAKMTYRVLDFIGRAMSPVPEESSPPYYLVLNDQPRVTSRSELSHEDLIKIVKPTAVPGELFDVVFRYPESPPGQYLAPGDTLTLQDGLAIMVSKRHDPGPALG